MKKIITSLLIVLLLFNVFLPKSTFARYEGTSKTTADEVSIPKDRYDEDSEKGSSDVNGKRHSYELKEGTKNGIINFLVKFFNIIPTFVKLFLNIAVYDSNESAESATYGKGFSIQKLVFNKIELFNIDFFSKSDKDNSYSKLLKDSISSVYYAMRNVAIIGLLVVLIYTGIRMALSTVAEKKAKYKDMLMSWLAAFVILITLPYIMIAIIKLSGVAMDLFEGILKNMCGDEIIQLEDNLLASATTSTTKGFSLIVPCILYILMVFYQLKFFMMYFKRLFSMAFLIVISPLVLIQHAFDKVGDGKAGAFRVWLNEFVLNVVMQPIHAAIFAIFMVIASNIILSAPLLAVIFFATLSRAERVIRGMLSIKESNTVQGMDKTLGAEDAVDKVTGVGEVFGSLSK